MEIILLPNRGAALRDDAGRRNLHLAGQNDGHCR